jgi:hypothetical protein
MLRRPLVLALAAVSVCETHGAAQTCPLRLLPGVGAQGVDGIIATAVAWDPDGAGPQPQLLVYSGSFRVAGSVQSNGLAAWDGVSWRDMSAGVYYASWPFTTMCVNGADLYAAGGNVSLDDWGVTAALARWNGVKWERAVPPPTGGISVMASWQGQLVAIGTSSSTPIWRWDGTSWTGMGNLAGATCLAVYQGDLYAGGSIVLADGTTGIARWNGSAWIAVGSGIPSFDRNSPSWRAHVVYQLQTADGRLFASGTFTAPNHTDSAGLRSWDGTSWTEEPISNTTNEPQTDGFVMASLNDHLYLGGPFYFSSAQRWASLIDWDGTAWRQRADDLPLSLLTAFQGTLVADAGFVADSSPTGWTPLGSGTNGRVKFLCSQRGQLFASGDFRMIQGTLAPGFAWWDGSAWHPMEAFNQFQPRVTAMCGYNGDLAVAGFFSTLDGVQVNALGRWNGQSWSGFGAGPSMYASVLSVFGGNLYAAGTRYENGLDIAHIVRWDGTSWTNVPIPTPTASTIPVSSMVVLGNHLIAGMVIPGSDDARSALGEPFKQFDGQSWTSLGTFLGQKRPPSMVVFRGELYATGSFSLLPGGMSVDARLVAWNGTTWRRIQPPSVEPLGPLAVFNDALYAGDFSSIYRWDGQVWTTLATGLSQGGPIAGHRAELFAGYSAVEPDGAVSAYLSRWTLRSACRADFNCSGGLEIQDIYDYIAGWFAENSLADFDDSGSLGVSDLIEFLNAWFAGCA